MDLLNRRRFISVGALTLLAGCTSDGGESADSTDSADSSETQSNDEGDDSNTSEVEASAQQSVSVKLGEPVVGDDLSMVAREVTSAEQLGPYQEAESGSVFVVVRLAVKNTSDAFINFNSFWQTRVKDSENHVYDSSFGVTDHPFDSGYLAPGEVSRGDVVYEVAKEAEGLTLQFDFSSFDLFDFERVTIDLAESANSITDLEQSLKVPVQSPGKSVSHDGVSFVVHDVRRETELGSYSQADEGYEYVVPDIEITNETGEALSVSTLLQMRVKTGTGLAYTADLMGSSALSQGYEEGSKIADGESRRGELAYQVSTDVEATYFVFDWLDIVDSGHKAFWEL